MAAKTGETIPATPVQRWVAVLAGLGALYVVRGRPQTVVSAMATADAGRGPGGPPSSGIQRNTPPPTAITGSTTPALIGTARATGDAPVWGWSGLGY